MDTFEDLLQTVQGSVERFVRFRISSKADADDILQETYLTAYQKFSELNNRAAFKAWILRIAKNKCNDYFRKKAAQYEIPIDTLQEQQLFGSRYGLSMMDSVRETLHLLGERDKQCLYLYFWKEMPQAEIAKVLNIPLGTVKSRLYTAKQNFKTQYPYQMEFLKGAKEMKTLPNYIPEYKIQAHTEPPFSVKWEELMGWFLVPKLGERISWGIYDIPSRKCSHICNMEVTGKATVHGIEGVELTAQEISCSDKTDVTHYTFIAQLTDTHCRYLAAFRNDAEVHHYITFLDGEEFSKNWGFGEDNCGNETNLAPKGDLYRDGSIITSVKKDFLLDIVGRYIVTIDGKSYDTVCVMDIGTYNAGIASEQFLDQHGKTILWRRFNRNDWAFDHYKKKWDELLPQNEKLIINGTTYVHWYDCITDYIL